MNRREFLAIAGAAAGPAASAAEARTGVFPARHETGSEEIFFAAPGIDWDELARRHAPWAFTDDRSPETLERIEQHACEPCGSSDVPFFAPLDTSFDNRHYYLVSPEGIGQLRPLHFAGVVRFPLDAADSGSDERRALGEVAAFPSPRLGPREGGFVIATAAAVHFKRLPKARFSARRQDQRLQCAHVEGAVRREITLPFEGYSEVETSYTFQANAGKFCFVSWQPDGDCEQDCCQWQYTLFDVVESLTLIDSNRYGCDL